MRTRVTARAGLKYDIEEKGHRRIVSSTNEFYTTFKEH
jgi:hypothetical protein